MVDTDNCSKKFRSKKGENRTVPSSGADLLGMGIVCEGQSQKERAIKIGERLKAREKERDQFPGKYPKNVKEDEVEG